MKAYQFLNKLLYASSDIHHVFIHEKGSLENTELYTSEIADPTNKENHHRELLEKTVISFRIKNDALTIYTK